MKYFLSEIGELFAYEADGSQDAFIKDGLIPLSDDEVVTIREKQANDLTGSHDQLLQTALARRDELLIVAGLQISPLQDAADLDEATANEAAILKQWKQYRLAVSRVSSQEGFPAAIQWPVQPTQ